MLFRSVHFLLTEDESGLLQSTVFERIYRESGHILYETSAYLLEGRVEHDPRRGFCFVVQRIGALDEALGRASRKAATRRTRHMTA